MGCRTPCISETKLELSRNEKECLPIYLIRHESGNVVYPSVNLYGDFVKSCKQYKVIGEEGKLTRFIVSENLEYVLQKREEESDNDHPDDAFQIGQILFEKGNYSKALKHFKHAILKYDDPRAKYQVGVMLFDNLLEREDTVQYEDPQKSAVNIMKGLLSLDRGIGAPLGNAAIVDAAAFNLFLAHIQGWGVKSSDEKALQYLKIAATYGDTKVSVMAQTAMGCYYSSNEHLDIDKAFYWHSEACRNGSFESQAIIGVLHMFGLGPIRQDWCAALTCLRSASERGSIYATGMLSFLYFRRGFYTLASRTAYSLVANVELQNSFKSDATGGKLTPSITINPRSSIKESYEFGGGQTFTKRALAVACFIYATCLDRGLGVHRDGKIASTMYSRCIQIDPTTTCRLQNMVIRSEL